MWVAQKRRLVKLGHATSYTHMDPSPDDFLGLTLTKLEKQQVRGKTWLMLEVPGICMPDDLPVLWQQLQEQTAAILLAVGLYPEEKILAIVHRTSQAQLKTSPLVCIPYQLPLPTKRGRFATNCELAGIIEAFMHGASHCHSNMEMAPLQDDPVSHDAERARLMQENEGLMEAITRDWLSMDEEAIHREVELVKLLPRNIREQDPRSRVIWVSHASLLRTVKDRRAACRTLKWSAHNEHLLPLTEFQNLHLLRLETCCTVPDSPEFGNLIRMPLMEWLVGAQYMRYSLVMHGASDTGKSLLAETLVSLVARAEQEDSTEPYYIRSCSVDSLNKAGHLFEEGVPLLLDEWVPTARQGTLGKCGIDALKNLLSVQAPQGAPARFYNVQFMRRQPRVITAQSTTAAEWHPSLPAELQALTVQQRRELPADTLAIYKRTIFCRVQVPLVSLERRNAFWGAQTERSSKRMRSVLEVEGAR